MSEQLINQRGPSEAATWRTTPKAPLGWAGVLRGRPASLGGQRRGPQAALAPEGPPLASPRCHVSEETPLQSLPAASLPPGVSSQRTALPSARPPPDQALTLHTETTALAPCRADSHFQSGFSTIWRNTRPTKDNPHWGASSRGGAVAQGSRGKSTPVRVCVCVCVCLCVCARV